MSISKTVFWLIQLAAIIAFKKELKKDIYEFTQVWLPVGKILCLQSMQRVKLVGQEYQKVSVCERHGENGMFELQYSSCFYSVQGWLWIEAWSRREQ